MLAWNLGRFSMPIGATASAFVALMVPILCLPAVTGKDLNAGSMNYTCLVYGAPMGFALVWWFVSARKWFKGPKVNLEHLMHGRDDQAADIAQQEGKVMDGQADSESGSDIQGVPGEMPKGYQVGDIKSEGL